MQKLLKRTKQAEKQVARRKDKRTAMRERLEAQSDFKSRMNSLKDINRSVAAARLIRREDWELGPLAPRRDTPLKDKNGAYWGSTSLHRNMSEFGERQRELACKWAGGTRYLCLKAGDRVAIMQGADKGKIGVVRSIMHKEAMVVVDGDHLQQNVTINEVLREAGLTESDQSATQLTNLQVPIQAVRLVHPLRIEEDGPVTDVIISELKPVNIVYDKPTKRRTWSRLVPSLNVQIPWPRAFEESEAKELEKVFDDNPCDTLRDEVEKKTFIPSLLKQPMPAELIDELRNKYSKFRTRHEPEYIARKEEEADVKGTAHRKVLTMQTPRMELSAKRRAERAALPEPILSVYMLEKIGELMFKAQQAKRGVNVDADAGEGEGKTAHVPLTPEERQKKREQRMMSMSKKKRREWQAYLDAKKAKLGAKRAKSKSEGSPAPAPVLLQLSAPEPTPQPTAPPPA